MDKYYLIEVLENRISELEDSEKKWDYNENHLKVIGALNELRDLITYLKESSAFMD